MTVQPSQGHEPGDTPPEELDRLIGVAAAAARELVGSHPSDPAGWLEHLVTRQLGDPGLHWGSSPSWADVTSASPISGYLHGPARDDERLPQWTSLISAAPAFESPGFVSAR